MTTPGRSRRLPEPPRASFAATLHLPLVLFSAIGFVYINVGAQVYLVEILSLAVCLHAFLTRAHSTLPLSLLLTCALWIFGTVLSDLANESALADATKGLARAGMLLVLLVALSYLVRDSEARVVSVWIGVAISLALALVLLPNAYTAGEPWKFGLATPVTLSVFILAATVLRPYAVLLAAAMATVNFVMGSRSLAIICLISALVLLIRSRKSLRSGAFRFIIVATVGIALIFALVSFYDQLALSGVFGEARRLRADYQSSGNLGVLATGRGEIFFSIRTIAESPIFGVGSYAPPTPEVFNAQIAYLLTEGYHSVAANYMNDGLRSFHSELFGAVAENGLLAAPFWVCVGAVLAFGLFSVLRGSARRPELVTFLSSIGLWDLFFSPFGADRRFWVAATVVSILVLCSRKAARADLNHHNQFQSSRIS